MDQTLGREIKNESLFKNLYVYIIFKGILKIYMYTLFLKGILKIYVYILFLKGILIYVIIYIYIYNFKNKKLL